MADTQPRASVYFSPELNKKIDEECDKTGLSKTKLIVKIVERYFENQSSLRGPCAPCGTEECKEQIWSFMVELYEETGMPVPERRKKS